MKNPKIIYILIGVFCLFAVIAGIYAQFFVSDENKPSIIVPNLNNEGEISVVDPTQEELKEQFFNIFNNQFNKGSYDTINIQKINPDEDIIYTTVNFQKDEQNYEINVKIPGVNIQGDVAGDFNNITQTIFVNKIYDVMNMNSGNTQKTIYNVNYEAFINENILSVIINSNLKEGDNPQRVMVQTYNYDLSTGEKVDVSKLLSQKNIIQSDCQNKIKDTIKAVQEEEQTFVQQGYPVYNRDLSSSMYLLPNVSTYFLGPNGNLYIIFAYGNQNYTSEMDIILYE